MAREASSCDMKELVLKFIPESIGKDIEKVRTCVPPKMYGVCTCVLICIERIVYAPVWRVHLRMNLYGVCTCVNV